MECILGRRRGAETESFGILKGFKLDTLKRISISIFLLILVAFFVWSIFIPKGDLGKEIGETLKAQRQRADLFFRGVTFAEIVNGIKYWEIKAQSSDLNKTTKIATMKIVDGTFFKKGEKSLKILAPAATWKMKEKEIYLVNPLGYDAKYEREFKRKTKEIETLKSDVSEFNISNSYELTKEIGYWFKAKNLTWKLATKKIFCEKGVRLTKGDITAFSERLEGDVGLEHIVLTGNPKANIEQAERMTLLATKFEIDSKSDIMYALGNVKFVRESEVEGDATIVSNAASYNQRENVIEASGNVKIYFKDIQASSNLATYFVSQKKITLMGDARASRGGDELRGEKIHIFLEENRIDVEGDTKIFIPKSVIEEIG